MLGLMQQLTVNAAAVRFDDDSLTGKVLNYMAGQQGAQPADIANQAKAIVPFLTISTIPRISRSRRLRPPRCRSPCSWPAPCPTRWTSPRRSASR
jgi:hypothetical protein